MKRKVLIIIAALILCVGVGSFVYGADVNFSDTETASDLSSDAVSSSLYSYNIVNMSDDSLTISYTDLKSTVSNSSIEGLKIDNDYGSIIMDKVYLASLLEKTASDITFSLKVTDNTVTVSAKGEGSTLYGDKGMCIVEIGYKGGDFSTSAADSSGNPVGTCCYYADGAVLRWQLSHSESYTIESKEATFSDIKTHWSKDYVEFLAARGVVNGMGENKYEPNGNLTRGQFITMLARISSADISQYTEESFNDVKESDYFYNAVCWGFANGIVTGRDSLTFDPNTKISRQEMAAMCWRYTGQNDMELKAVRPVVDFDDSSSIHEYAKTAVAESYGAGFINGRGDDTFDPLGNATRGEAATLIAGLISYVTAMPH